MSSSSAGTSFLGDGIQYNPGICYEDMMAVMEDDLICPICRSLFEEPQLLSCTHGFCKDCLEQLVRSNTRNRQTRASNIKCPVCRMENLTEGPDGPKANYLLKSIVENFSKMKAIPRPPLCKVHAGQPLNMFCTTDMKLICGPCVTSEEHKQHTFSSIGEAFKQEKSALEELLLCLKNQEHDVLSCHKALERNKAMVLRVLSEKAEKIELYFEKFQNDLEQRKNKVLSEIAGMKEAVKQTYDPEIRKVIALMIEHEKAQRIVQDCRETSEPYPFLNHLQKLREKMASIEKIPLPAIPDDLISPAMKAFDPRMWNNLRLRDLDQLELPPHSPVKQSLCQSCSSLYCDGMLLSFLHQSSALLPIGHHWESRGIWDCLREDGCRRNLQHGWKVSDIYNRSHGTCAQSVLSFIWRKDQGTVLDMEKTATPAPPADRAVRYRRQAMKTTNWPSITISM